MGVFGFLGQPLLFTRNNEIPFCDLVLVSNDVCVTLTSEHCGESTAIAICIVLQLKCHRL